MTDVAEDIAAQVGHNQPPSDLELLRQRLDADPEIRKIIKRKDDLLGAVDRAPEQIETAEQEKRMSELRNYISACVEAGKAAHKKEKDPFWEACKQVDAHLLHAVVQTLIAADAKLEPRIRKWKLDIAEAERQKLRREAEARQLEADLRAAAAVTEDDIEEAIAVESEAKSIASHAELAKPADLPGVRTTNDIGKTKGLRTNWAYRVVDINKVPLDFLTINEVAMKARIASRPKDQPPIPVSGIEFYPTYKA